jgi:hypothetical protein
MCLSYWYAVSRVYGCTLVSLYLQRWPQILEFVSLVDWKWCRCMMIEADIHLRLLLTSILDIYNVFEVLLCCLKGLWVHLYTVTLAKLAPYFGLLGHLRVEMMPLCHGWGWYPPQTASHIHSRNIKHVWAIGMLSHRNMGVPLYNYAGQIGPRFWNLGHLWTENDAIAWWLRLTSTSDCFQHLIKTYKMWLRYCFAVSRAYGCTLILLY